MRRWGSAAGAVAAWWSFHGHPPSETLDCHHSVLQSLLMLIRVKEDHARNRSQASKDQESWGRMRKLLGGS